MFKKAAMTLLATAVLLPAQPPRPPVSPEVSADRRVTFRFKAPNAKEVAVALEGSKPAQMTKDEATGVWSLTTDPLEPDYYGYTFVMDGTALADASNPVKKPNFLYPSSEVHVPGEGLPWELANVPHGTLHRHFYHSEIVGDDRDFYVYTPPKYDAAAKQKYPVLYLLHGFSDDASGWTAVGRAHIILDNLIAQGKAKPMIVVMPLGYGAPEILKPPSWNSRELVERNFNGFRDALLKEVIPQVEKSYKVTADRNSRAIAGLSMGGAESLLTGLNNLDTFAYVGAFSSGGITDKFDEQFANLENNANSRLKLLWVGCGTEDGLIKINRAFDAWLKSKNIRHEYVETPGAHTWMVWRRYLATVTPMLFQAK